MVPGQKRRSRKYRGGFDSSRYRRLNENSPVEIQESKLIGGHGGSNRFWKWEFDTHVIGRIIERGAKRELLEELAEWQQY